MLTEKLDRLLMYLAGKGVTEFYCGGALGFDTLAEEAVLRLKEKTPYVRLHLILPSPDQAARWRSSEQTHYRELLEQATDVEYVADRYSVDAIFERNRRLVDYTGLCVCYQTHSGGGTDFTVGYARKRGKAVIQMSQPLNLPASADS